MSAKGVIERFSSAHGCLNMLALEGRPAIELLAANPLVGFCLAVNEHIKKPPVVSPQAAARFYVTKPQREILAWLGFEPATESVAKIGRKCVPASLTIDRCREFRFALREEDARQLLAHVPRINAGVIALVGEPGFLAYLTSQLLQAVSEDLGEDTRPWCAELLRDIYELDLELGHGAPTRRFSSLNQMSERHQELIAEITRRGGKRYRGRSFPSPPVDGITTSNLTIKPIVKVGELDALGRDQRNCVASYARLVFAGSCYIYKVTAGGKVWTLCISKNHSGKWEPSQLKGLCNRDAPEEVMQAVQQWLCRKQETPRNWERQ